eukprot:jgi/Chlat1/3504/Chrsp23S03692
MAALAASQFLGSKLESAAPVVGRQVQARRTLTIVAATKKSTGTKNVVAKQAKKAANALSDAIKPQVGKMSRNLERYGRELWLPNIDPPEWLDGSMVGDRGFDPLGLSKPAEYLQVDLDDLDQNAAVNKAGDLLGTIKSSGVAVDSGSLQPYNEVFDIKRFRECELIHGRWAMLAVLGALVAELSTGVSWYDAGKVELDNTQYLGLSLPFTITQLCVIEAVLVGWIEILRNGENNPEKRCYPGGVFDPLGLASDPERAFALKTAEIKHARLAMVAAFGFAAQAAFSGSTSPLNNLKFLG